MYENTTYSTGHSIISLLFLRFTNLYPVDDGADQMTKNPPSISRWGSGFTLAGMAVRDFTQDFSFWD